MSLKETQVEDAGKDVSRHTEQERQVWLGEDPARTVHEEDAGTTSLAAASTSQGALRSAGGDGLDELPAGSSALSPIALVGRMSPSGLPARMLEEAPQPHSDSDRMVGGGNQAEYRSLDRMMALTLDRLEEVLSKLSAFPVVNAPVTAPEAVMIAPDRPTPPGFKPHSTTSATPKKWIHCPSLGPYVEGATLQFPLSDLDIQNAIRAKTGYAPSRPTIRKHIRKLADEGKVEVYAKDRDGNLIPYPTRRTTLKPFVVWRGGKPAAHQLAPSDSPEPGGAARTQVGSASPSSPATGVGASDPRSQTARHEMPPPRKGFPWLLRQLGIGKAGIPTGH